MTTAATETTTDPAPAASSRVIHVAVGSKNPCKIAAVRLAFEETFSSPSHGVTIVLSCHDVSSGVPDQPFGDDETRRGARNRARAAFDAALQQTGTSTNGDGGSPGGDDGERRREPPPDFGVGLEGGVECSDVGVGPVGAVDGADGAPRKSLWCMAWMAVVGSSSSSSAAPPNGKEGDPLPNRKIPPPSSSHDTATATNTVWGFAKTASFALPHKIADLVLQEGMELGHADDRVFGRTGSKSRDGTVGYLTGGRIGRSGYYVHALELALVPFVWPEYYGGG